MKYYFVLISLIALNLLPFNVFPQDKAVSPSMTTTGTFLGETPPLRDLPALTDLEWQGMLEKAEEKILNPKLRNRTFPFSETAFPKGPDPVWQKQMGANRNNRAPILNFAGQSSPYYPPDANGTAGPNHYMQTINSVYAIYDKSGTLVTGPTALNTLFTGVTGSQYNDGDPIVLYDEQADRWLVAEFSISGSNDYMLVAVSTTNDPTGTWYKYSFDVADMPDYPKLGIWRDGYYMATNTNPGGDIYVMQRSQMLAGGTAQAVGFDNPWRPGTIDGFMCVPPVDNDGTFAPLNSPGLFVTINDDAIGGGSDQLWIYELDVNWDTLANSTFTRTQQIDVAAFDSNFGNTWNNISQPGTSQKLDAIPMVVMNVPQYRNFGTYETLVCCHTVDVDGTDHAGIRWYELRRTDTTWSIRQQGTYAPDQHSRWMGSIMLNGSNEIAIGYSISSSTVYPGIRYCGQSSAEYAAATGILNLAEEIIQTGSFSQTATNRWGDYSALQVDPVDDETFWFTTEYIGSGGTRQTRIATFQIGPEILTAGFTVNNLFPATNTTVSFSDQSTGSPTTWDWSITPGTFNYVSGTSSTSQDPQVQFTDPGTYSVTLTVSDGIDSDTLTRASYIQAFDCNISLPFEEEFSFGTLPPCWTIVDHLGNGQTWKFNNPGGRTINTTTSANGFAILDSDFYGSGNSQNCDLVSPLLDFFNYTTVALSFEHYFLAFSGSSGNLSYSTDGGSTWTSIQSWTTTTANAATFSQDLTTQLAGKSNVRLKWNYTGTYGYYWALDDIIITGTAAGIWTGATSADWNITSNWINSTLPASSINVTIPGSSPNWPMVGGDLTLGTDCRDLRMTGTSMLMVNGGVNVPSGSSFTITDDGTVSVEGDWSNHGNFHPGSGTIEFSGSSPQSVTGKTLNDVLLNEYSRETFAAGMALLTGASAGPTGDNSSAQASLGFTFYYAGTAYTSILICTNGWASLDLSGGTSETNEDLFSTVAPNTTLAPWFDNLKADGTSLIQYKTEGAAPDRVFTIEWKGLLTYRNVATARVNFQLKLYETTNIIEFHYGNLEAGNHNNSEGASIGLEDGTGGAGHFIEATTGSMSSGISDLKSATDWPLVNYRFIPPVLSQEFHHVIINNSGGNVNFNINTNIHGDFSVSPGGSFNVATGKSLEIGNN